MHPTAAEEPGPVPPSVVVDPAPVDAVTRVAFSPDSSNLLVSTWAGTLSLHVPHTGNLRAEAKPYSAALLDAAWSPNSPTIYAASVDGTLLSATLSEAAVDAWRVVGTHAAAVRAVVPAVGPDAHLMLSASWDSRIRAWDPRVADAPPDGAAPSAVATIDAGGKVYGGSRCGPHCAIFITSQRRVRVVDVRNTSSFLHDRVPPTLAYQLRGISATDDGLQYVVGGTEGRVAVEWLDESAKDSFSFRCHRVDGLAFPVNCVAHNNLYGSFATGGGDGHVSFWDGEARKRIAQYSRYPTSVASIAFDKSSTRLAIAVSYTFEEGEKDHPPDEVHVRRVDDAHIITKRGKEERLKDDQVDS